MFKRLFFISILFLSVFLYAQGSLEDTTITTEFDSTFEEFESSSSQPTTFIEKPGEKYNTSKFEDSLKVLNQLLSKIEKGKKTGYTNRRVYFLIGNIHRYLGKYQLAVEKYEKALKLSVEENDLKLEASVLNSLGGLYYEIGEYQQGLNYCDDALNIYQKYFPDKESDICLLLANIGNIYLVLENFQEAINFLTKANDLNEVVKNEYYNSLIYSGLGFANFKLENYDVANNHFKEGLNSARKSGDIASEVANLANLGDLWLHKNNFRKAERYIYEAFEKVKVIDEIHIYKEVLELLIRLHEAQEQYEQAFLFQKKYNNMKDSLFSMNLNNKLAQAAINIDNIQKENEILELTVANERQEFQLRRTRYIILFSSIVFILAIIILIALIQRNRFKNKIKLNKLENKMIRLQLKPHFIFNVLSSIQNFMTKNDPIMASSYLSKFARLIRNVLNASRTNFTPLSHEIKMLKYYLELQQLRFDNKFDFNFEVKNIESPNKVLIPPLMVQPIVENAVEHGLKNIDYRGKLSLEFEMLSNQKLKILIIDNGIGVEKSKNIKKQEDISKKSISLVIIRQQIKLFDSQFKDNFKINFSNGKEKGTIVELIVPCKAIEDESSNN